MFSDMDLSTGSVWLFGKISLIAAGSLMAITSTDNNVESIGGWALAVTALFSLWQQLNKERKNRDELHLEHMRHLEDERKRAEAMIRHIEEFKKAADKRADERSEAFFAALSKNTENVAKMHGHCERVWENCNHDGQRNEKPKK